MNVVYVTSNYESVQKHLVSSLNSNNIQTKMYYYNITHHVDKTLYPRNVYRYMPNLFYKGPMLYISRIKAAARYFQRAFDLSQVSITHGNMLISDGIICRYLHDKYRIPYVVTVRDTDINTWFNWKLGWIKKQTGKNIEAAKKIIFLGSEYKNKLRECLADERLSDIVDSKSIVIPNGIDEFFLENINSYKQISNNCIKVIFIGKLEKRKNLELTVEAIKLLRREGLNIILIAIGDIIDKEYKKVVEENSFIQYHPRCGKEEVLTYLRSADIFCMPSHRESFGLAYAEALSQGLPVLYTKGQGFDNQYEDGTVGYAVNDRDSTDLANKIKMVINNYDSLSKNCIQLSGKFDWNAISKELIRVYDE